MTQIRDPATGQIIDEYPDDGDPFPAALQEALDRRLLEFTGEYRNGRPIFRRTAVGHGPS